jgi:hypothetical protein
MVELSRRSALIGALFAPAIIRLPGLLMPTVSRHVPKPDTITVFDDRGNAWTVPIRDGGAQMIASRPMTVMPYADAIISGLPVRTRLEAITSLKMEHGATLNVSGLLLSAVRTG